MTNAELTLPEWLTATGERRGELETYAKSPLPRDASERHADIETAIQSADDSGRLLADLESYLSQAKAQAMFSALEKYPDLNARERDLVIRSEVRAIKRIVDGMHVTDRTIKDRIFSSLNANRAGF